MNVHELHNNVEYRRAISPVAGAGDNTAFVSQIINMQGFTALEFIIALGALPDTDATFAVLVEHGDAANLADASAVPDDELLGLEALVAFTFAADDTVRKIGYRGSKQYVRLTITPANNTGANLIAAIAALFPSTGGAGAPYA